MGIKNLNRLLLKHCYNSSSYIHLSKLFGKKIAIDVSIYLYKYERHGQLLKNIYDMIALFKKYHIIPVFVFDGRAPKEKKYVLKKRKEEKKENQEKINKLSQELELCNNELDIMNIKNKITKIESHTIHITREKIEQVKHIIRETGMTYFDAPNEADELCAMLAIRGQVWACISDDTDLFVYGCPRIIRDFNVYKFTGKIYNTESVLFELGHINLNEFRQICILSGTDYNSEYDNMNFNISYVMDLFKMYLDDKNKNYWTRERSIDLPTNNFEFVEWVLNSRELQLNVSICENIASTLEHLKYIYEMFDLSNYNKLSRFNNILIMNFLVTI